jgi:hypothetical protein
LSSYWLIFLFDWSFAAKLAAELLSCMESI